MCQARPRALATQVGASPQSPLLTRARVLLPRLLCLLPLSAVLCRRKDRRHRPPDVSSAAPAFCCNFAADAEVSNVPVRVPGCPRMPASLSCSSRDTGARKQLPRVHPGIGASMLSKHRAEGAEMGLWSWDALGR